MPDLISAPRAANADFLKPRDGIATAVVAVHLQYEQGQTPTDDRSQSSGGVTSQPAGRESMASGQKKADHVDIVHNGTVTRGANVIYRGRQDFFRSTIKFATSTTAASRVQSPMPAAGVEEGAVPTEPVRDEIVNKSSDKKVQGRKKVGGGSIRHTGHISDGANVCYVSTQTFHGSSVTFG